jgi:hypothetical protein
LAGGSSSADWNCSGRSPAVRFIDVWSTLVVVSCVVGVAAAGALPACVAGAPDSAVLLLFIVSSGPEAVRPEAARPVAARPVAARPAAARPVAARPTAARPAAAWPVAARPSVAASATVGAAVVAAATVDGVVVAVGEVLRLFDGTASGARRLAALESLGTRPTAGSVLVATANVASGITVSPLVLGDRATEVSCSCTPFFAVVRLALLTGVERWTPPRTVAGTRASTSRIVRPCSRCSRCNW